MKTLSISLNGNHCSEYFRFNGTLFKVEVRNGNCYFDCDVYRETVNGDFARIACRYDIEGIKNIPYYNSDETRISIAQQNIQRAKEWIRVIYTK